jgi:predicted enzyme related to lactoylglutathione lyase
MTRAARSRSVTFSTDDADATAAKAAELGGTVFAPPIDAPYSRMTVLGDPQGATSAATAFVPCRRLARLDS